MKHILMVQHTYSPSNNLQKAVKEYLISINRRVFDGTELDNVKFEIVNKIHSLSQEFKRCHSMVPKWENSYSANKNDWHLSLGHNVGLVDFYIKYGNEAPSANQLNLLDEIAVSKKTMAIGFNTEAMDIIDNYAPELHPVLKEKMAASIERVIEHKAEHGNLRQFNERLEKAVTHKVVRFDVPKQVREDMAHIATYLPAETRATLMQLTRKDIEDLKRKWDRDLINELRDLLSQNLVDIYYDSPLNLPLFLDAIGEKVYTTPKLLRLLSQGKVSTPRIEAMINAIKKEYKVLEPADELEAQESW